MTGARIDEATLALEATLGAEQILSDPLSLRLYARDASMVEGGCALVAFPRSSEDVQACVRIAAMHALPIVPRGSGTGLAGAATPLGDALVVVTTKMNRILEVRPDDGLAWVEPGLPNLDLSTALAPSGYTYAPDPSSQQTSSIGGNVNTNAGGPHCLAYGVTSAHVLAVDVVLADGSVHRLGSESPEAAGYDLRGVVVGSEGTLGIVTRVCVRILPAPPVVRTMLLDFMTIEDCSSTVSGIIARGVIPAAIEMMDQGIVRAAESFAHAGYPTDAAAILIVEVDGTQGAVDAQTHEVETAAHEHAVRTIRVAADERERALLWKGRKSAFGAVAQIAPHYHLHDCVVPRTKLTEVLSSVYAIAERHGLIVTNVFHAGDGNLHPLFSFDRSVPGTLERVLLASDEVVRLCVDAGGALSGEHGIGLEKRDFMPLMFSDDDLSAQACLRSAFDPDGRMNPQKVLPDGARCGDFAVAHAGTDDAGQAAGTLPEGSWI
ncbi:MAG TPA: FAD-linked oxidase C-terminal domain-containing protein [Actinomycetota bacterium]